MATLTTTNITRLGVVTPSQAAAGGGDAMSVGSQMFLLVTNGGGSPITVTLVIPAAVVEALGIAYTSPAIVVPNASNRLIGPVPSQYFQDPVTGLCTITYSGVTTVTVGALQLTQP